MSILEGSARIPGYPKILTIGHPKISDLLTGSVSIEEKVDGSNFSFMVDDKGQAIFRSRKKEIYPDDLNNMFELGVEAVEKLLEDGNIAPYVIFRCEYLRRPRHNLIKYDRIPNNHLIVLDVSANRVYLTHKEKKTIANKIGFETVPLLFEGKLGNPDEQRKMLESLLETESILGGAKVEGVVIKSYDKWTHEGFPMWGKIVRDDFKEKMGAKTKKIQYGDKVITQIVESLKTEARWNKALQSIKEDGLYTGAPENIPHLLRAVHRDIDEEELDWIKEQLMAGYVKKIKGDVCKGLAEWYKFKILEGAIDGDDTNNG